MRLCRDDGAIVYLNGKEILQSNKPGGRMAATTSAEAALGNENEAQVLSQTVPATFLAKEDRGTVAVEVHQADASSCDLYLDLDPDWPLPEGKFSEWHVLAIEPATNPKAYCYAMPAIILEDTGCFSASDIFLGGFEGLPNATLMGTPSGGGNGWMETYALPDSGIRVTRCQSAKFRPDGKLDDTVGVVPDILVEANPEDYFSDSDDVLEAAIARLGGSEE